GGLGGGLSHPLVVLAVRALQQFIVCPLCTLNELVVLLLSSRQELLAVLQGLLLGMLALSMSRREQFGGLNLGRLESLARIEHQDVMLPLSLGQEPLVLGVGLGEQGVPLCGGLTHEPLRLTLSGNQVIA